MAQNVPACINTFAVFSWASSAGRYGESAEPGISSQNSEYCKFLESACPTFFHEVSRAEGQTLGQTASFRQTAPETWCQSRVCGVLSLRRRLFVAQCGHRVQSRRAAAREVAGDEGHRRQQARGGLRRL